MPHRPSTSLDKLTGALRFLQGLVAVLTLTAVGVLTFHQYEGRLAPSVPGLRRPAAQPFVDLTSGWEYALAPDGGKADNSVEGASLHWEPFDPASPSDFGDKIEGHYWLRRAFDSAPPLTSPSLVLGLVASYHRTFLNGKFIGGSDYWEHVAHYPIDPSLLHGDRPNWIVVKAHTRKVLRPGILKLDHIGLGIGEYGEIQRAIQNDTMEFFVLRTVYLVITFLTSLLCLFYWAFRRERKYLVYFSLYLMSGTALLLYYNFYVITALDYAFYHYLKTFALGGAAFILGSAFACLFGVKLWETAANFLGGAYLLTTFLVLVPGEHTVTQFVSRWEGSFKVAVWALGAWLIPALGLLGKEVWTTVREKRRIGHKIVYGSILCLSAGFTLVLLLQNAEWIGHKGSLYNSMVTRVGVSHSFLFSLVLLVMTSLEHIRAGKRLEFELEKDRFNLDLVRDLALADDMNGMVHIILEKMCRLVGCERATLYLVENETKNRFLEASYIFGDKSATKLVQRILSPERGLIGKVIASRKPVLVTGAEDLPDSEGRDYKTKSCLLVPLVLEKQFVGILTVADPKDGRPLTRRHLDTVSAICKDLVLVAKIVRLEGNLKRQIDGIIAALAKMIEKRDPYTEFHSQGVMYVTERIAEAVGRNTSLDLRIAALLHDVGKVFVPARVLNKPGPLNERERDYIQKHSRWSSDILRAIPGFEEIAQWAGLHHESIDGKGYPYGLTEDLIPVEAQIISLADFVDALATNRAYRPKFDYSQIESMLREGAVKRRFDPGLVEGAIQVVKSADFRKLYSERGLSYRPEGTVDQATFEYYLEPFAEFAVTLEELNAFMEKQGRELSPQILQGTVATIRKIGEELTRLAGHVGRKVKEGRSVA